MAALGADFGLRARSGSSCRARQNRQGTCPAESGQAWANRLREASAGFRLRAQPHPHAWKPQQRLERRPMERAGLPPPDGGHLWFKAPLAPALRAPPPGPVLLPSAASPARRAGLGPEAERKVAAEPAAWRVISPALAGLRQRSGSSCRRLPRAHVPEPRCARSDRRGWREGGRGATGGVAGRARSLGQPGEAAAGETPEGAGLLSAAPGRLVCKAAPASPPFAEQREPERGRGGGGGRSTPQDQSGAALEAATCLHQRDRLQVSLNPLTSPLRRMGFGNTG